MKETRFQDLNYDGRPFLWAHRNWTEQDFAGYYHWHHGFEVLFVHRGEGFVIVNQQSYELRPGMLFLFQPLQLHKVYAEVEQSTPYERSVFHFDPVFMEGYLSAFPALRDVYTRIKQGLIRRQGIDLSHEMEEMNAACGAFESSSRVQQSPMGRGEQAALYMLRILSAIQRTMLFDEADEPPKQMRHSERVMQWIELHYAEPFELDRLADELHMSKAYLSRLFRRETGSSITGYLTARRIQQACSLLQTSDQSIEVIGERVGLANASYFVQLFKKVMGIPPHQYRLKL